jgi:hypothetical protein
VRESVVKFLNSLDNGDYLTATLILDEVMAKEGVEDFSTTLEKVAETDGCLFKTGLLIRDCFAEYLGFGPIYFALLMPSYDIFKEVACATSRGEAQDLLASKVLDFVEKDDSRIDLSFLEIDSLVETPFVLLIPNVLSKRTQELETCKIQYSHFSSGGQKKRRFCLSELHRTHYGRKIVSAFGLDTNYLIIGESDFQKLHEALQSFGLDVGSILVEVSEEDWPHSVTKRMQELDKEYMSSDEVWLLYRTYIAMLGLSSDHDNMRLNALANIEGVETKFCNDALLTLIANGSTQFKMRAIRIIEKTRDHTKMDFLCSLIPHATMAFKDALLRAISTIESAQYFVPKAISTPQQQARKFPTTQDLEMAENYMAALNQLSRSSSTVARLDAVRAISSIKIPGVETHLRRLMKDEDPRVRLAVLDASSGMPREQAFTLVRTGLHDIDTTVEKKALQLFEERWPDSYW